MLYDRNPKRIDAVKVGDKYIFTDANDTVTEVPAAEFEEDYTRVEPRKRRTKVGQLLDKK